MYRLWSEEPRARHGLPTVEESDRAVINEAEFLAYVNEFPILVETFGLLGARAMFHRCGSDEMLTLVYTRAFLSLAHFSPVARVARSLSFAVSVPPCIIYTSTQAHARARARAHTHTGTTLQRL